LVLNNYVNRHDAVRLARKLGRGQIGQVVRKVRVHGTDRVVAAGETAIERRPEQWWDIPAVVRRWNVFASGDPRVSFPEHVARTWLANQTGLRALSMGCGMGYREMTWAKLGVFEQITGVDVSPEPIRFAAEQAKEAGLDGVLDFRVADFREMLHAQEKYDVVLGLHSLHHFDHIDETMSLIAQLLPTDGLLIVDEFVGPTKFQWTGAQLAAANALLATLPTERRVQYDGRVKRRVIRPSLLSMRLDDPSEAVEASRMLPAVRRLFTVLEEHPYGGTVLHIALSGIAQNFLGDDPVTAQLLKQCFAAEDEALPRLGHDFTYMVCRPKPATLAESAEAAK
jgi:2-polyprenyl-3-methyl-5-hydroxy-6-metoxy-1,4-benzoquinol methylase